jgi:hypothetical protein
MEQNDENARKLLIELGLFSLDSASVIEGKIYQLNMRQMDRLKMMLQRLDGNKVAFTEKTKIAIKNNDFGAFAEAIITLNTRLR